jgi:hypothetical protein
MLVSCKCCTTGNFAPARQPARTLHPLPRCSQVPLCPDTTTASAEKCHGRRDGSAHRAGRLDRKEHSSILWSHSQICHFYPAHRNQVTQPDLSLLSRPGLHSFSKGIPKDTLSLGKGPSAYPTYPRIVISAGRAPRRYPYPPYRKPWPAWWCSLQCGHVQALHGNQPHFMRRLRASSAAARVHTQLPLPGSRSNAGQLNLPLQSADYHQTVTARAPPLLQQRSVSTILHYRTCGAKSCMDPDRAQTPV